MADHRKLQPVDGAQISCDDLSNVNTDTGTQRNALCQKPLIVALESRLHLLRRPDRCVVALAVAIFAYGMPAGMAGNAALLGGFTGLLPIGWIVLNIIFLHQLTEEDGSFKVLQNSLSNITDDRRLQLLLIAFAFGAFFEGAAGFGETAQ